jgi:trimeric autotransporter adhesin
VVDNLLETMVEAANEGDDTIESSVSFTLSANVERMILTGAGAINGTGNALDNVLIGNGKANTLTGAAGDDTLDGGAGADWWEARATISTRSTMSATR